VIEDESTLLSVLDEEDQAGLEFVRVLEFDTEAARVHYLRQRGW
jgi:hypothetical protein